MCEENRLVVLVLSHRMGSRDAVKDRANHWSGTSAVWYIGGLFQRLFKWLATRHSILRHVGLLLGRLVGIFDAIAGRE